VAQAPSSRAAQSVGVGTAARPCSSPLWGDGLHKVTEVVSALARVVGCQPCIPQLQVRRPGSGSCWRGGPETSQRERWQRNCDGMEFLPGKTVCMQAHGFSWFPGAALQHTGDGNQTPRSSSRPSLNDPVRAGPFPGQTWGETGWFPNKGVRIHLPPASLPSLLTDLPL
jgi:hypothetical protein